MDPRSTRGKYRLTACLTPRIRLDDREAPRSGALYQYFSGKDELLAAAVERKLETLDDLGPALEMLPLGDLESELRLLARWNLRSLADRDALTRFVLRDAEHLPARLRRRLYERLVERPYAQVVAWVEQRIGPADASRVDVYAFTLILVESMAAYTSLRAAFDRVPDHIDDDRFVEAWVDLVGNAMSRTAGEPIAPTETGASAQ